MLCERKKISLQIFIVSGDLINKGVSYSFLTLRETVPVIILLPIPVTWSETFGGEFDDTFQAGS